jgi:secretory phospholipase A2
LQIEFIRCGVGHYGSLVADATDNCCRIHDQCYARINGGILGCSPKIVTYSWKGLSNKVIECTDPIGTCDRNACECDKAAADCYQRHRFTYYAGLLNMGDSDERIEICNP